jgi:DNA-binding MarR family transcriptional regulator
MAHLQVLWLLGEHGPLPVGRLADLLGVAVPNATGLIDRMEQRNLVTRTRVPGDRRVVLVSVTDAGRETADQVDGWRSAMLEGLFRRLDTSELRRLAEALEEMRDAFPVEPLPTHARPCAPEGALLSEETLIP